VLLAVHTGEKEEVLSTQEERKRTVQNEKNNSEVPRTMFETKRKKANYTGMYDYFNEIYEREKVHT